LEFFGGRREEISVCIEVLVDLLMERDDHHEINEEQSGDFPRQETGNVLLISHGQPVELYLFPICNRLTFVISSCHHELPVEEYNITSSQWLVIEDDA
jgi:hypothetical protein